MFTRPAHAAIRFDVFLGYDDIVPEATWFPLICEVNNDGPSFKGTIEITTGRLQDGGTIRETVELPTGTLKRIVVPVFAAARYQSSWDIRLLDERNRVRAEQLARSPKRQIPGEVTLLGAVPRSATGMPALRQSLSKDIDIEHQGSAAHNEFQPATARLIPGLIPDNPLLFDGLHALYLNSEKAADLTEAQVKAMLAWLNAGGHLIVGIEQIGDVNSIPWLRRIIPCDLSGMRTVTSHPELQEWLRTNPGANDQAPNGRTQRVNRPGRTNASGNPFADQNSDATFETADIQVVTGTLRGGEVVVSTGGAPLIIQSQQGRGRVTALMFSPEREPFHSWKNLPTFWTEIAEVPLYLYRAESDGMANMATMNARWGIDGVFGAMVDSRQVRKLPVEWLLLLLIVYLVVIGPFDQYCLKRLKRPMLTWITFPCYVVLFSLLIYFIGYKLRAGDTEWNELHIVDVLPRGEEAELRGHTYASVYSPVNATYRVENPEECSTFRGEFHGWNGGGQSSERSEVLQVGDNFKAAIFVPVWTSQLYESDWWQSAARPLDISPTPDGLSVIINNHLDHKVSNAYVVYGDRMVAVGDIEPGKPKTVKTGPGEGRPLGEFVQQHAGNFTTVASQRTQAFGASGGGRIDPGQIPDSAVAVSFLSRAENVQFVCPPGLDLTSLTTHGNVILLAWDTNYSPIKPMNLFPTLRNHKDTLWRIAASATPTTP